MATSQPAQVVVAGAGMAGLAAALAAQDAGARVLLLEAGDAPGGSAALSAGFVTTFSTYDDLRRAVPLGDPDQGRRVVEGYDDAVRWLQSLGMALPETQSVEFRLGRTHRMDPPAALAHLAELFRARGGSLRTRTRALQLHADDDGRPARLTVASDAGGETIAARTVVLATGGFQGNRDLTTRYLGRWADRLPVRSNPCSVGDGFLMGQTLGAGASRGLHAFYGHLLPAPPAVVTPKDFLPTTAYYSRYVVLVNLRGERFTDESLGDEMNAQAAARQDEARVFAILDRAIYQERILNYGAGIDRIAVGRGLGGPVATAPTLDALVEQVAAWGVRPRALANTLASFNRAMAEGSDASLDVPRARHRAPLATPDYTAVALTPAITFTHGGLRIDDRCRVLDRRGAPIPGLYAAGADAGGTWYERYGGGLAMALTLGRLAGTEAAGA